jgi:hypothetical protein
VSVIDADPQSSGFMTELQKIPTKITGNSGTIFTGPLDLAVTPNGRKLYIAYGENLSYPAKSSLGVIDLTQSSFPEKLIPMTTGGTFWLSSSIEVATHPRIKMSTDGLHAYVCEWGLDPALLGRGRGCRPPDTAGAGDRCPHRQDQRRADHGREPVRDDLHPAALTTVRRRRASARCLSVAAFRLGSLSGRFSGS